MEARTGGRRHSLCRGAERCGRCPPRGPWRGEKVFPAGAQSGAAVPLPSREIPPSPRGSFQALTFGGTPARAAARCERREGGTEPAELGSPRAGSAARHRAVAAAADGGSRSRSGGTAGARAGGTSSPQGQRGLRGCSGTGQAMNNPLTAAYRYIS